MSRSYLIAATAVVCLSLPTWVMGTPICPVAAPPPQTSPPAELDVSESASSDAVQQYADHFRKIAMNYHAQARLLESVEDASSADAILTPALVRCDEMETLLAAALNLPELGWTDALRLKALFGGELQQSLANGMDHFVQAGIQAGNKAQGSPALETLSARYREMSSSINAALARLDGI